MHMKQGVCDFCQRSEEVLSELQRLKLAMFIRENRQDSYWINLTANYICVCAGCVCTFNNSQDSQSGGVLCDMEVSLSPRLRLHSQNQA